MLVAISLQSRVVRLRRAEGEDRPHAATRELDLHVEGDHEQDHDPHGERRDHGDPGQYP